jgi:hypothetical protein
MGAWMTAVARVVEPEPCSRRLTALTRLTHATTAAGVVEPEPCSRSPGMSGQSDARERCECMKQAAQAVLSHISDQAVLVLVLTRFLSAAADAGAGVTAAGGVWMTAATGMGEPKPPEPLSISCRP